MSNRCPCGSALEYSLCCQPYLSGKVIASNPGLLMRSRYTAFVEKCADYLIQTWHPSCEAATFRQEIEAGFAGTEWLGLTLFEESEGSHSGEGFVSFVARFRENGKTGAIIERSRFLKENGQWYYIDGTRPQFGRNDPCPCGSGKKFKKCCGQ
ncbi:YchJ family protein [Enterobacter sp. C2]|uniref:YchJ family protein n=1 Tax=Enterobacter sp. C2 TaxID=2870346 RepID=UPI001CA41938|nr:YchJ family protein [Enterobacter sp. C2]